MSAAAAVQGYRFARYGPIAEVLSLQKFTPTITNAASQVIIEPKLVPIHRTEAAVVNGTGANTNSTSFPKTAGYEGIAVVADAASNSKGLKNGDWVYVLPSTENYAGTWANKNVVSTNVVIPIRDKTLVEGNLLASCLSCFLTAAGLLETAAASNSVSGFAKGEVIVQNGGSSLTSLAVSALGQQKGLKVITAATAGTARFAAAEKRHKQFGQGELFAYNAEGARKAGKAIGTSAAGARAFFNGVGGSPFNDFLKLAPSSGSASCSVVTYGAQNSFGLMFAGSNLIFKNISSMKGFYLPRYLASLSEQQRVEKVGAALELAKQLKGQYPVEVIKSLDGVPAIWDKLYIEGGAKGIIQF